MTRAKVSRQSFAVGVGRALRRAAKDAQKIARMYGTPLYVWENRQSRRQEILTVHCTACALPVPPPERPWAVQSAGDSRKPSVPRVTSRLYFNAFPVDRVRSDPSVDESTVVANLEPATVDCLHKYEGTHFDGLCRERCHQLPTPLDRSGSLCRVGRTPFGPVMDWPR